MTFFIVSGYQSLVRAEIFFLNTKKRANNLVYIIYTNINEFKLATEVVGLHNVKLSYIVYLRRCYSHHLTEKGIFNV